MIEIWKPIEGFSGYDVSNLGRVRSSKRRNVKILKPDINHEGYYRVTLSKDGKTTRLAVHRLVAAAFIGDIEGMCINHLNGDPSDNVASNLEICTHSENERHKHRVLKSSPQYGEHNPASFLNDDVVRAIRKYRSWGFKLKTIGHVFGIREMHAQKICAGRLWKHVA